MAACPKEHPKAHIHRKERETRRPVVMHLSPLLLLLLHLAVDNISADSTTIYPQTCTPPAQTCTALLYHVSRGLSLPAIAALYSANASLLTPITKKSHLDYLVSVPCTCSSTTTSSSNSDYYFHNTAYAVKAGDTPMNVTNVVFGGMAYNISNELFARENITVRLVCGCYGPSPSSNMEVEMVTYTVQRGDTLSTIAALLSSEMEEIQRRNEILTADPEFLIPGGVLFVPMGIASPPSEQGGEGRRKNTAVVLGVLIPVALFAAGGLILFFCRRRKAREPLVQDPESKMDRNIGRIASLESKYNHKGSSKDPIQYDSERPLVFSLEDVERATANFDETRKIGQGGYGSVYLGSLGEQEVAVKMMKSTKSREFFAELKILCKVHHINVVELIGYAAGDEYLYLVYEYVQNGSLSEHLHDPLLKGHQPLSWTARTQIALDAARGIEYIHDHTKACYVHRDIKTANILLDIGLRAKIADFGLAKLVERSEDDFLATRLVGTPGYLPPESVCELQMTTKSDVFAFGVVLAELITGYRALFRDNKELNKMKSLISIMKGVFQNEDPSTALEDIIDGNLRSNYPIEEVQKMAEISIWCLEDEAAYRPEMRDIMVKLSQVLTSSIEWEASLGGNSQVFSGIFNGR